MTGGCKAVCDQSPDVHRHQVPPGLYYWQHFVEGKEDLADVWLERTTIISTFQSFFLKWTLFLFFCCSLESCCSRSPLNVNKDFILHIFSSLSIILEYPLKTQQVKDLSFGLFHIHTFRVKGSTADRNINPRHSYSWDECLCQDTSTEGGRLMREDSFAFIHGVNHLFIVIYINIFPSMQPPSNAP